MRIPRFQLRRAVAAVLVGAITGLAPTGLTAAEHVVPAEALVETLEADAAARVANEAALQSVFESESARKVLHGAGLEPVQVSKGVVALDDDDLAHLAERARAFEAEVAAGALNNQQITYILIALGTAVIVLLLVGTD